MKPPRASTYLPDPDSLISTALLLIHAAGPEGISSCDLAREIDRDSNVMHGLVRHAIHAGVLEVNHLTATNARGAQRRLRRYIGTALLPRCIAHIEQARAASTRPAPPLPSQPQLDTWLRTAAATIPRIPLPGFRLLTDFTHPGHATA